MTMTTEFVTINRTNHTQMRLLTPQESSDVCQELCATLLNKYPADADSILNIITTFVAAIVTLPDCPREQYTEVMNIIDRPARIKIARTADIKAAVNTPPPGHVH